MSKGVIEAARRQEKDAIMSVTTGFIKMVRLRWTGAFKAVQLMPSKLMVLKRQIARIPLRVQPQARMALKRRSMFDGQIILMQSGSWLQSRWL